MRIVHIRSIVPALFLSLALPLAAHAQVGIGLSVTVAPPEIPVYEQPPLPGDGYVWTPGFWQWGPEGYFWVPGTWVEPPSVGLLWTPGYWGWGDGAYIFHGGYWGPHVGFYGGVNYGFGYGGSGYEGGYWRGGHIFYNRAVVNVGEVHITNVYNKTVIVNNTTRVSFNGGAGGVRAAPTRTELAVIHERHIEPTRLQTEHVNAASSNRELLVSVNHGAPAVAATPKPGVFAGRGVVSANHAPERADRPPAAARTGAGYTQAGAFAPPVTHTAPVTNAAPTTHTAPVTNAAPVTHAAMTHAAPRAPAAGPAAAMTAHPAAAPPPPPHPAAPVAPARPAAMAPPHPPVQQQRAAPAPRTQGQGHDDRHD